MIRASSVVLLVFGALGCAGEEQRLGGPAPSATDDPSAPSATNATHVDVGCPVARPAERSPCALAVVEPCTYHDEGVPIGCVCGSDRQWTCLASSLGVLAPRQCAVGGECNDGVTCQTANQLCRCEAGRFRCLHE